MMFILGARKKKASHLVQIKVWAAAVLLMSVFDLNIVFCPQCKQMMRYTQQQ